ncbi:MAG: hypothetical protein NTZ79_16720 [Proteobacteria bacterium]|nr:hypothetical protein [Pseudomonadota bacterium]
MSWAPARSAAVLVMSVTSALTRITGTGGWLRARRSAIVSSGSSRSSANTTSSSGLIWIIASPRSAASGSQVQCTAWPARRRVELIDSTWSC